MKYSEFDYVQESVHIVISKVSRESVHRRTFTLNLIAPHFPMPAGAVVDDRPSVHAHGAESFAVRRFWRDEFGVDDRVDRVRRVEHVEVELQ